ncbi:retrovirus-related pol polyprotein from transposon TNT 1-94 [Tanacetum coccineum]|uniref:Retrovirus-related pol polyprotein from transposon TNT 1-94 n=1 Tax=Tanacetum coccineum TaxID=301880 RepID=A0ABQ5FWC6_9ASTR
MPSVESAFPVPLRTEPASSDEQHRAFVKSAENGKMLESNIIKKNDSVQHKVKLEPDKWIKDSGCSRHMTGNKKLFSTYKEINGGNVLFGGNTKSKISGNGKITHNSLSIHDVSHVENLSFNLLSISQICDKKCKVLFSETGSEILKDGITIGKGIRKNGLYIMKMGNSPKDTLCLTSIDDTSTLWHRRLGHANMRLIQSLSSKELVRNLPKLKFEKLFCDACNVRKQAPRTPQSNGVVERKNRTLQEMARIMLNEQSIPQKFWCNVVDTSTYILNRILIRPFLGKTPYELFQGKNPSLEHFKVFGSKCFILNTKDYLTKFDPKSIEGVFLGYSPNNKAYIVINKETMKVEESLNVKFDETSPPKSSPLVDDDILENDIIEDQDKDLEIKEK